MQCWHIYIFFKHTIEWSFFSPSCTNVHACWPTLGETSLFQISWDEGGTHWRYFKGRYQRLVNNGDLPVLFFKKPTQGQEIAVNFSKKLRVRSELALASSLYDPGQFVTWLEGATQLTLAKCKIKIVSLFIRNVISLFFHFHITYYFDLIFIWFYFPNQEKKETVVAGAKKLNLILH